MMAEPALELCRSTRSAFSMMTSSRFAGSPRREAALRDRLLHPQPCHAGPDGFMGPELSEARVSDPRVTVQMVIQNAAAGAQGRRRQARTGRGPLSIIFRRIPRDWSRTPGSQHVFDPDIRVMHFTKTRRHQRDRDSRHLGKPSGDCLVKEHRTHRRFLRLPARRTGEVLRRNPLLHQRRHRRVDDNASFPDCDRS